MKPALRVLPALGAVMVAASLVLGADRAAATKALNEGIASHDGQKIKKACEELIQAGGKESFDILIKLAEKTEDREVYYQVSGAATGFEGSAELEELGNYIIGHQKDKAGLALSRDLLFRLQNNPSNYVAVPLAKILKDGVYDLQLVAVDQLAKCRSADAVDALIEGLKREDKGDPQLKARLTSALVSIAGQDKGDIANWEGWWKEQKPKGVPEATNSAAGGTTGPRDLERGTTITKQKKKNVIVLAAFSPESKPEYNDFDYDSVQDILQKHEYPHKVVKRADFEKNPDKYLIDAYALLINCHYVIKCCRCPDCTNKDGPMSNRRFTICNPQCPKHDWGSYALSKATLEKIKKWVEEGGFLYTEDWGLVESTGQLWPDKISMMPGPGLDPQTRESTKAATTIRQKIPGGGWIPRFAIRISPGKGNTTHPLMRGVWDLPKPAPKPPGDDPNAGKTTTREESPAEELKRKWDIEDDSPIIEIHDHDHVYVLIESEDLDRDELAKLVRGNIAVAVTFRVGPTQERKVTVTGAQSRATGEWSVASKGGRVLHTVSHYGHQNSKEDGDALDNLLLNFLMEAQKHHEANAGK
ncbi:hypothetical protein HY251_10755 [bacterium]|nr:hypothetical protein [bacterium]